MARVRLYREVGERLVVEGDLEFFGIPLGEADQRSLVDFQVQGGKSFEVETQGRYCTGQVRLIPEDTATDSEIQQIAKALCNNQQEGKADRYIWKLLLG
ncbi:MAG: hypothetical protein ACJ8C4_09650 [Gemmataceae bacterium]